MGDKSKIEWTEATWNPIAGCSIVSPGCQNCYAMGQAARIARMQPENKKYAGVTKVVNGNAVWTGQVNLDEETLLQPLRWQKPRRIFVNSMSDLFHESLPDYDIAQVFAVMGLASWHTFQVLTKRPARMAALLNSPSFAEAVENASGDFSDEADEYAQRYGYVNVLARMKNDWRAQDHAALPMPNVWLGVSVENQATADERIPHLLRTPAAVRWLSCEPLLDGVDLSEAIGTYTCFNCGYRGFDVDPTVNPDDDACPKCQTVRGDGFGDAENDPRCRNEAKLDWVVVGGESGAKARPMHPDWARSLRDQCQAAGVPYFFKQWGEWAPSAQFEIKDFTRKAKLDVHEVLYCRDDATGFDPLGEGYDAKQTMMFRVGKKAAGRKLDGRTWDEFPQAVNA